MKLFINAKARKDGKYACTYGFDNGARFKKIKTKSELIDELEAGFDIVITDADFDNTLAKATAPGYSGKLMYEF